MTNPFDAPPSSSDRPSSVPPASERRRKNDDAKAREEREKLIDAGLCELLETSCEKINEGNNGFILRLNVDQANPTTIGEMASNGVELRSDQALKLLKVYTGRRGMEEFNMQAAAYDILSGLPAGAARVPRPILYRDLALPPSTQEILRRRGLSKVGERVEVLAMDLVRGVDLATIIFTEVLRRHPKTVHLIRHLPEMSFDEMEDEAYRALNLAVAGGKGRTEGEREHERRVIGFANIRSITSFLMQNGFQLHPSVPRQIETALNTMHQHGIAHRDGHHRNFMVVGPYEAGATQEPQAYIIDFGSAVRFEGDYRDPDERIKIYREGSGEGDPTRQEDEVTVRSIRQLSVPEDEKTKILRPFMANLTKRRSELAKDARWKRVVAKLAERVRGGDMPWEKLPQLFPEACGTALDTVAMVLDLVEAGQLGRDEAIQVAGTLAAGPLSKFKGELARCRLVLEREY